MAERLVAVARRGARLVQLVPNLANLAPVDVAVGARTQLRPVVLQHVHGVALDQGRPVSAAILATGEVDEDAQRDHRRVGAGGCALPVQPLLHHLAVTLTNVVLGDGHDGLALPSREDLVDLALVLVRRALLKFTGSRAVRGADLAQRHRHRLVLPLRVARVDAVAHLLQDLLRLAARLVLGEQAVPSDGDDDRLPHHPALRDEAANPAGRHSQSVAGHPFVPVYRIPRGG